MRIRTIKPEFWQHEGMATKVSEFGRLMALALLNYADDEGYFLASPALIRGSLFAFVDDSTKIQRALKELSECGWIECGVDDQARQVGRVVNFRKHQKIDRPQPSKIKGSTRFVDDSSIPRGEANEPSLWEQGSGIRERDQGKEQDLGAGKPPEGLLSAGSSIPQAAPAPVRPKASDLEHPATRPEPEKKEGGRAAAVTGGGKRDACATGGRRDAGAAGEGKRDACATGGRRPDDCFEFMVRLTGATLETVTSPMRGEINKALKTIREVSPGVLVAEMRRRAAAYHDRFKDAHLSPSALAKHWGSLAGHGGAKKEGGAAVVPEDTSAPTGHERACVALYGEPLAWALLGEGQQAEVREWLARAKKEGGRGE